MPNARGGLIQKSRGEAKPFLVAVLLLDRFGRRVFLLVGTVGLIVSWWCLGCSSPRLAYATPFPIWR
jgi:hypothetical protein